MSNCLSAVLEKRQRRKVAAWEEGTKTPNKLPHSFPDDSRSSVSIKFVFVAIFLTGSIATGISAWVLTSESGLKSISQLSQELQLEVQLRLADALEKKIQRTETVVNINREYQRHAKIEFHEEGIRQMMVWFASQIRHNKDSTTATLTTKDGQLWGYFKSPVDGSYGLWKTVNGTTTEYKLHDNSSIMTENWSRSGVKILGGQWYSMVDQNDPQSAIWTPLYFWEGRMWCSRSMGAYSNEGVWMGVISADIEFRFLDVLIEEISVRRNTDTLVIDDVGYIIGTTFDMETQSCLPKNQINCTLVPLKIQEVQNPVVQQINNYVSSISSTGWNGLGNSTYSTKTSENGVNYLINISRIYRSNLAWIIVNVVSEDEFVRNFDKSEKTNVLLVFSVIASLSVVTVVFGLYISSPLLRVAKSMEDISELRFDRIDLQHRSSSILGEIRTMQASFQVMEKALQFFEKFVPADVIRIILESKLPQDALQLQRKTITIVFYELKGVMDLDNTIPLDVVISMSSEYMAKMVEIIQDHQGIICDFVGSGMMAIWNAPVSNDDHPHLALRAALEQKEALEKLNLQWIQNGHISAPLPLHIGVHTGEVYVGNIGSDFRLKYGAVGDGVNLASRLLGLNKRYQTSIIVSSSTFQRVSERFICRPLEQVVVKGRSAAIKIYELMGQPHDRAAEEMEEKIVFLQKAQYDPTRLSEWKKALDDLSVYTMRTKDETAKRLLGIYTQPGYNGISVLDEK
eukprot:TRINITY_DN3882_c0_g1_i15.p1 TRINITY_DN3882_c0_g1~~TRINITY_DN3882_c0_g1_i15.p1  ORF type:complete len:741 (+),score=133.17 TRINITY_DN3882_c0_g1_i15:50-2272(+)